MRAAHYITRRQPSGAGQQRQHVKKEYLTALDEARNSRSARKRLAKNTACASVYAGSPDGSLLPSENVFAGGVIGRELKLAEALRRFREELRQLSSQLLTIQERERQRIAADLHDGVGQSLSLVKLSLASMIRQLESGQEAAETLQEPLQQAAMQLGEAITELHRTAMDLRPPILDDLGIIPALSWFFREFELAWRDRKIERDISIAEGDIPNSLKTAIYRILQEAVHNVVKHADAKCIRVSLKMSGRALVFLIEDDGVGFDPAGLAGRGAANRGFGMLTMRERTRASDGTFTLKSAPGKGTRILVSWQLAHAAAQDRPCQQGKENAGTGY